MAARAPPMNRPRALRFDTLPRHIYVDNRRALFCQNYDAAAAAAAADDDDDYAAGEVDEKESSGPDSGGRGDEGCGGDGDGDSDFI
jgi:hypothetical protein